VFVLTDGEVDNTEQVIRTVRENVKYARVHAIGIGGGASVALIKGCAEKGKGHHIFIEDHENPAEKIIQLLSDSLTPVISKVRLDYDKDLVESIVPNPHSMPYILKNEVANFYITFKGQLSQATQISLSYEDSKNNLPFKSSVDVLPDSPSEPCIDKMAHYKAVAALEESEERGGSTEDYLYWVKVVNKKLAIVEASVRHQVLSKHTAFLCVEQELVDGKYHEIKGKEKMSVAINTEHLQPVVPQQDFIKCCFSPSSPQKMSAQNSFGFFGAASTSTTSNFNQLPGNLFSCGGAPSPTSFNGFVGSLAPPPSPGFGSSNFQQPPPQPPISSLFGAANSQPSFGFASSQPFRKSSL
jgi:hypothetical protein